MSHLVHIPPGQRTAADFVNLIYEGELFAFMEALANAVLQEGESPILMEDGAPIHRALVSRNWLQEHGYEKLIWPACSPDLNPIENIWSVLKDAVQRRRNRPRNIEEMIVVLHEEWDVIRDDFLTRLYSSLPERLRAVITARGGHTKW